ncbi:MAG TPA: hypothetical protein VFD16_01775 [Candidatus Saccharimonadales bacterium]|nr:hypothetical protein [Candidatus Saccharimonadales bacterium]
MYYYVNQNAQENGDHEVHQAGCPHMPDEENRFYLGNFDNCREAVAEAKNIYPRADGCFFCANPCHTR